MYAIVEIAGQQFKVAKDQRLYVHRLNAKEGDTVTFDNILLVDNGGKINVGAPAISGASVSAKVIGHLKGDKVIVFKKKRRKGYQKSNGHRQYLTQIEIQGIAVNGSGKSADAKSKPAPKAETKAKPAEETAPKAEPKTESKAKAAPKAESKPKDESAENK